MRTRSIQWLVLSTLCFTLACRPAPGAQPEPGLSATYTSFASAARIVRDIVDVSEVACYVPTNHPPTPFLPPGKFDVVWRGALQVDLRSEYRFQAEVSGTFELAINGQTVLSFQGEGGGAPLSKPIRLNKGSNELVATLISAVKGDTFLRLQWTDSETALRPLPASAFVRGNPPGLEQASQLRLGRALFLEHRCVKCHAGPAGATFPEATLDAPSLENIGSRRGRAWMARWIDHPSAQRPSARMPELLHGPERKADAEAMATYLKSRRESDEGAAGASATEEETQEGAKLFQALLCANCHLTLEGRKPGEEVASALMIGNGEAKVSLAQVNAKFVTGHLEKFLLEPERHYAWTRMPNFRLSGLEARQLAGYLQKNAEPSAAVDPRNDPAVVARGQALIQSRGCLNCHAAKLQNNFSAPTLADLPREAEVSGCLAPERDPNSFAPQFVFTALEREALRAFLKTDRISLQRHVTSEFASRQTRSLNCAGCHGQPEGFPTLAEIGSKLRPEWIGDFLGRDLEYKPRPWLAARMPKFPNRALPLANGLAAQSGFAPVTPAEPPIDAAAVEVGRKLVSKEGGFSCVACHAVGAAKAVEVFESEGINLRYAAERLRFPYFQRWLLDPLLIDPQTKMPDYFDGFTSPLPEYYEGDARRQVLALWQYFRLGPKMPLPKVGEGQ